MYLLGSQEVADLFSRDTARPIFHWLEQARPGQTNLFVSAISLGQVAHMIETLPPPDRNSWRRLHAQGRRTFAQAGGIIAVDLGVVDVWASSLRGRDLFDEDEDGEPFLMGEDDRLIIATAISRGYSLVTRRRPVLNRIAEQTTLTIVEP